MLCRARVWTFIVTLLISAVSFGQGSQLEAQQANARRGEQRVILAQIRALADNPAFNPEWVTVGDKEYMKREALQLIDNQLWELRRRGPIDNIPMFLEFVQLYQLPIFRAELVNFQNQEVPGRIEALHNGEFQKHIHNPEPLEPNLESQGGVVVRVMNPFLRSHFQQGVISGRWVNAIAEHIGSLADSPATAENLAFIALVIHQMRSANLTNAQLAMFGSFWTFEARTWQSPALGTQLAILVERIQTEARILIREKANAEFYAQHFRIEVDRLIGLSRSNPANAAKALEGYKIILGAVKAEMVSASGNVNIDGLVRTLPMLTSYLAPATSNALAADSRLWTEALVKFVESVHSPEVQVEFDLALVDLLNKHGFKLTNEVVNGVLDRLSHRSRPLYSEAGNALATYLNAVGTRIYSHEETGRSWNGQSVTISEKSREYLIRLASAGMLNEATWTLLMNEVASRDILRISNVVKVIKSAPYEQIQKHESALRPLLTVGTPANTEIHVKAVDRILASGIRSEVEYMLKGPQPVARLVRPGDAARERESNRRVADTVRESVPTPPACYPSFKPILGLR